MGMLARLISWLNAVGNGLFGLLNKPMTVLPAWLSLTLVSAVLGVLMLILFKYTSNQAAIGRVRDAIKANLLAMKLFKDNIPVVLKSQAKILLNAFLLLVFSLQPMLVMIIPFSLLLGQLGLWYQSRPLEVDEQAVVTMQLADSGTNPLPSVSLLPSGAARVVVGPIRVPSKRQIYWQIQARENGEHTLIFQVAGEQVRKELAVGDGLMPVSMTRPGLSIMDLVLHPAEKPFDESSSVQSIRIGYPDRRAKFTGTDIWIVTLFVISMLIAFLVKPFLNVKI
ncbi:MAG: hypothetical protein OEV87_03510 [Phycisphaerae bacterium]|nr:hypothetical protein [Phycisphaerae bacterium]